MMLSEANVYNTSQPPSPRAKLDVSTPYFHLDMQLDFLSEVGSDP